MKQARLVRLVMKAVLQGWVCVWLILLLASEVASFRTPGHIAFADRMAVLLIYAVVTGIVTFLAMAFFIVPYIIRTKPEKLLQRPWRMYLETSVLALLSSGLLTLFMKAQSDTFVDTFIPISVFALGVSVSGSFFYLRAVKKEQSGWSVET